MTKQLDSIAAFTILLFMAIIVGGIFYIALNMDKPMGIEPESDLLWADMDVGFVTDYVQTHYPDHKPTEIEFVWRVADLGGSLRGYWVIREVE